MILLLVWCAVLVGIWVRYDWLPHAKLTLVAILLWPAMMVDEWIRAFEVTSAAFLGGVFQFVPAIMAGMLLLVVRQLLIEKPTKYRFLYLLPGYLILLVQLPMLLLPEDERALLLFSPALGAVLEYWSYWGTQLLTGLTLLVFSTLAVELFQEYHQQLSDQVVDIKFYRFPALNSGFIVLILVAFATLILTGLAALISVLPGLWVSVSSILIATSFLYILAVLLERRKFSPNPLSEDAFGKSKYSDELLRYTLKKVEQTIIRRKAYKFIGLRIRQLADAAGVDPQVLASATRAILNRNFRAFIYHYRLEYAKKVLMQTDTKVSSVAKRLGFNSERFLSDIFIRYIHEMGKESDLEPEQDRL